MFDVLGFGCAAAAMMLAAACTSTESTLDPNALATQQAAEPIQPAPAAAPAQTTAPTSSSTPVKPAASATQSTSLRLGGMVGAPTQAVQFLTARMQQQGPARNIAIAPDGATAAYAIRGLVSTSPEAGKTVIDFTWELTDKAGATVHRASGKRTAAGQGDGWQAVTQADMESIADDILNGVSSWLATR